MLGSNCTPSCATITVPELLLAHVMRSLRGISFILSFNL
jgi:hypothetical protein